MTNPSGEGVPRLDCPFELGGWVVDPTTGEMRGPDGQERLEPKVLDFLVALIERPGEVVSKAELLESVWDGTAVSDDVVWRCAAALRKAFHDNPRDPRIIETLPRRGYRCIAPIRRVHVEVDDAPVAPRRARPSRATAVSNPTREGRRTRRLASAAVAAGLAAVALALPFGDRAGPEPRGLAAAADHGVLPASGAVWTADDYTRLGRQYYERRGRDDLHRAVQMFEAALEVEADHAAAWAGLADACAQLVSRFEASSEWARRGLEAGERAVSLDPDSAVVQKAYGFALTMVGEPEAAIAAYRRALDLRPGYAPAATNLAAIHAARGDYHQALARYTELDTRGLNRALDLHNIGDSLLHVGFFVPARRHLEAALAIDPLQTESIVSLVMLDLALGRVAQARKRVDRALAAQSNDPRLPIAAAEVAVAAGDLRGAQARLRRVLEGVERGAQVEAHVLLAWIDRQLGGEEPLTELLDWYQERLREVMNRRGTWRLAQVSAAVALLREDREGALQWIRHGAALGHLDFWRLRTDPVFGELHGNPDFEAALQSVQARWGARDAEMLALLPE